MTSPNNRNEQRPKLVIDLPLIRRYARRNEAEDNAFRTYLKYHLPVANAEIDATVQAITRQVWSGIDCLSCGNCCRTLQVVVDDQDISRLSAHLRLSRAEFMRQYVTAARDGVRHFNQSPCPFLGDANACSVYENRPQSCRDFPYLLDANFRRRSVAALENVATCPIVFNVWQQLKRRFHRAAAPVVRRKRI